MNKRRGYVVTFAVFMGKVPMAILQDVAETTNTQLLGVDVDVVLKNRAAARTKFQDLAKKAARSFLEFVQLTEALRLKTVKELPK